MQKNDAAAQRGGYYGYYPVPGPMLPPPRSNGRGLAIAAVSLAGIGLMGCWIPFLNVYSFVTFPIVLALAVGALVTAKRDPRVARVLAIVSIGIAILSAVLAWAVNSGPSTPGTTHRDPRSRCGNHRRRQQDPAEYRGTAPVGCPKRRPT